MLSFFIFFTSNGQPNGSTIHYKISKCPYWGVLKASLGMGFCLTLLRIPRYLSLFKEHVKRSLTRTMSSISSNEVDLQSELVRSFLNLDRLDPNIFRYQLNYIVVSYTFFVQVIERKKTVFFLFQQVLAFRKHLHSLQHIKLDIKLMVSTYIWMDDPLDGWMEGLVVYRDHPSTYRCMTFETLSPHPESKFMLPNQVTGALTVFTVL